MPLLISKRSRDVRHRRLSDPDPDPNSNSNSNSNSDSNTDSDSDSNTECLYDRRNYHRGCGSW